MERPLRVKYTITSNHGDSVPGSFYGKHLGNDYAVPLNTEVFAPVNGTVVAVAWDNSVGNWIQINEDGSGRIWRFLHLNRQDVRVGQHVNHGNHIGLSGSTGSSSTGPHLHVDCRRSGTGFGDGFGNYFDVEQMFKTNEQPVPPPSKDWRIGKVLYLKPVPSWSVYDVGQFPDRAKRKGYLIPKNYMSGLPAPRQFGLTYIMLDWNAKHNTATIMTSSFGMVDIYVDSDAEII